MRSNFPLDLAFRGSRDYLHGTDLYETITHLPGLDVGTGSLGITFHSRLRNQPDLLLLDEQDFSWRNNPAFRGELRIGEGSSAVQGVLLESARPIVARKPCNEPAVAAFGEVDVEARRAFLKEGVEGSPIEQIVFLNKKLHQLALPELGTKWLFARLELVAPLNTPPQGGFSLHLAQVLGGRFTRTNIEKNGQRLGTLFFSLQA